MKSPSVEPVLRSRLLPRISFRWLFALTTAAALVATVARAAGSGGALAYSVVAVLVFVGVCFSIFFVLFLVSWLVSSMWYTGEQETEGSPFADEQLPPQILPPREQGS